MAAMAGVSCNILLQLSPSIAVTASVLGVSGIIWSYSTSADWQLIWHCALSPSGDMSHVIKIQEIHILLLQRAPRCNFPRSLLISPNLHLNGVIMFMSI